MTALPSRWIISYQNLCFASQSCLFWVPVLFGLSTSRYSDQTTLVWFEYKQVTTPWSTLISTTWRHYSFDITTWFFWPHGIILLTSCYHSFDLMSLFFWHNDIILLTWRHHSFDLMSWCFWHNVIILLTSWHHSFDITTSFFWHDDIILLTWCHDSFDLMAALKTGTIGKNWQQNWENQTLV